MEIDRFEALLKRTMGLDAGSIGSSVIARAVRQRMAAGVGEVANDDEQAYWLRLQTSEAEMQALIEAVVVPETWFFRHREAFALLARLAMARVSHTGQVLRLLSLPCSTGEEPYSMAMALLDAGIPADRFQIDAVDISARALEGAQRARYGKNSFRGESLSFRDRYFAEAGDSYALSAPVRRQVQFQRGNLFSAALLADRTSYDFIFCRNVLIYFDRDTQLRAIDVLDRLMGEAGVLFVGPAEASLMSSRALQAEGPPQAFAFRKRKPVAAVATPPAVARTAVGRATPSPRSPISTDSPGLPVIPVIPSAPPRSRRAPRPAPATTPPRPAATAAPDVLTQAAQLADQGRLDQATALCEAHVHQHGGTAGLFYLMGVIRDAQGQPAKAREYYRKTLYLEPDHHEALIHLATLLERQGDKDAARVLSERARRTHAKPTS